MMLLRSCLNIAVVLGAAIFLYALERPLPLGHADNHATTIHSPNAVDHAVGWRVIVKDSTATPVMISDQRSSLHPSYAVNIRMWRLRKTGTAIAESERTGLDADTYLMKGGALANSEQTRNPMLC